MTKTKVAMVASEIRKELKATFPTIKFSVRSSNYSMGSSIRVEWTDLPSVEAVEAITDKHSSVRRCEVTGEILGGGNMFIDCEQEFTPEFKELVESQMEEHEKDSLYWRRSAMNRIMNKMWEEKQGKNDSANLHSETPMSLDEVANNDNTSNQATLTINEEKNGIEIKFASKPSANVIESLKEMGFKWSSFNGGKWWVKNTPERLKYASMLVEQFNVIMAEEVTEDMTEEETEGQVHDEPNRHDDGASEVQGSRQADGDEKIKVSHIIFEWSESSEVQDGHTVNTFAEADKVIKKIAQHAPNNGAYDKTSFKIVFTDGQTYKGRYDVTHADVFNGSLSRHVTEFVKYSAGIEQPSNMSHADWESMIRDTKDKWLEFYNTYELCDEVVSPEPEPDPERKVIPFTKLMEKKAANYVDSLTPEQKFKLMIMIDMVGKDEMSKLMSMTDIDTIFRTYAERALSEMDTIKR